MIPHYYTYLQQSLDFLVNESLGGRTDLFVFISVSYWANLIRNSGGGGGGEREGKRKNERGRNGISYLVCHPKAGDHGSSDSGGIFQITSSSCQSTE